MRKYGVNNFRCYLVEETDSPNEREKFWIQEFDTYAPHGNGYNATLGGDGRSSVEVADEEFIAAYNQLGNVRKVGELFNCEHTTVSNRLKKNGIILKKPGYNSRPVIQYSMEMEFLRNFDSCRAAARAMIDCGATNSVNAVSIASNIRLTALGERTYAYGFKWKFLEEVENELLD